MNAAHAPEQIPPLLSDQAMPSAQNIEPVSHANLPAYERIPKIPTFDYNNIPGKIFLQTIENIYERIITWRKNIFLVPTGKAGNDFVHLLATWLENFNNNTTFKGIAIKVFMILPSLLLQKPFANSKTKANILVLQERLKKWNEGKIDEILRECMQIQNKLTATKHRNSNSEDIARIFAKLMLQGKVNAALRYLSEHSDEGVLPATEKTIAELKKKHPDPSPIQDEVLFKGPIDSFPVHYFDNIDEQTIKKAARMTKGAAGPSQLDAEQFRRILCTNSFKTEGKLLREQIACLARSIASTIIDPELLEAYVACRLIPLNKNPGVRPIGIGEILRRIIGKSIGWVLSSDIQEAGGSLQASTGLKGGAEAAIHLMRDIFNENETDGVILVDASNAFNSMNRQVALHNIRYICLPFSIALINTYRIPSRLFVSGGKEMSSQEGTTQGDNLAMSFYGLGINPLLKSLKDKVGKVKQVWLADDATGAGKLKHLRTWWDLLIKDGNQLGYFVNESKSWLIIKDPANVELAQQLFANTSINITTDGKRHLGAAIGSESFKEKYIKDKVDNWCKELRKLSEIAKSQPQVAFAAYIHGEQHRFSYFLRTLAGIDKYLQPLDDIITNTFIPTLLGSNISDQERDLFALPIKQGGMGIEKLVSKAEDDFTASKIMTAPLVAIMALQSEELPTDDEVAGAKKVVNIRKVAQIKSNADAVRNTLPQQTNRIVEETSLPGASNWLSAMPLADQGLTLNKCEFRDALALRFNRQLKGLPSQCPCGQQFNINHAMNCKRGGFVSMRHNDIRDFEANLLSKVCNDVEIEPQLQPLTGENLSGGSNGGDQARLDVRARGFWRRGQNSFIDVRVTNTNAESQRKQKPDKVLIKHEKDKKRQYNQRVMDIKQGKFTPLVFSIHGAYGPECAAYHKHLAEKIAEKTKNDYAKVMTMIRVKLSFLILRAALLCARGSRSPHTRSVTTASDDFNLHHDDLRILNAEQ